MSEALSIALESDVAMVTLRRPETKNALDPELVAELGAGLERLAADPAVRVVVLTGAGGAFCSGADLQRAVAGEVDLAGVGELIERYHRVIRAIAGAPQPVIAMVDGPAAGFGCDLALACDLRILSDRAFFQEAFVRIGLMPDGGGTLWLARALGLGPALELLLTGERLPAARAGELGLANRVVAADQLADETAALAARLAAGPPLAMAAIKRATRAALGDLEAALAREKQGQLELLASADFAEGVQAWAARRAPRFGGR